LNKKILKFDSSEELENDLSRFLYTYLSDTIRKSGYSNIALSGGRTPLGLYSKLSGLGVEWSKVSLTLVDERLVPPESTESNQGNIFASLDISADELKAFNSFKHFYKNNEINIKSSLLHKYLPFDVCLLGMGEDGHFASIFPNLDSTEKLLNKSNDNLVALVKKDGEFPIRFTLTFNAISQSKLLILYIRGQKKLNLIERVSTLKSTPIEYPIRKVLEEDEKKLLIYWSP
tara:strand:- start:3616 stop:4308 length:693 start_codon:yes stop_codon:yes gene_type:complete